jgi:hypothetical protein
MEDLVMASLNPRATRERLGIPHPLARFGSNGSFRDNTYADAIAEFINDLSWDEPDTPRHRAAIWFLFHSEKAFFLACAESGIDAEKLRSHLLKCQSGKFDEAELDALFERGAFEEKPSKEEAS